MEVVDEDDELAALLVEGRNDLELSHCSLLSRFSVGLHPL